MQAIGSAGVDRQAAAEKLGNVGTSHPRIVRALIDAREFDPYSWVNRAAAESLCAPVHQELLQQDPELTAAAESAHQQALGWRAMGGTSAQRRIYPRTRIQKRPLVARIMGVLFALAGLGLLVGSAIGATGGIDLVVLTSGFVGFCFTFVGLLVAGFGLGAMFHRGAFQGLPVTADGRIVSRDIEEVWDGNARHLTYWITFGFLTTEGPVRLKVWVGKRRYDQLKCDQPVMVRYAQENPRIALLEWEE